MSCDEIILCGEGWGACSQGAMSFCNENDELICYPCEDESRKHETLSGLPVCCTEDRPRFCDENSAGYPGGCWSESVDCATITACGDSFAACHEGGLPYCDEDGDLTCYTCPEDAARYETTSGRPVCCPPESPTFCDENDAGYPGGCWGATIGCETIIECDGFFGACPVGQTASCEDGALACRD